MIRYVLSMLTVFSFLFSSDNKKLAQTGFQFLSIASDARSGGMADAMTTMHSNSVSIFFNPAGLSRQNQFFDINSVVVVIFCDHGSRYMSKIYSDQWMKEQGFFDANHLQDEKAIEYIK